MDTENLVLRPNCLLTKYPLVFLTGTRSLFYYRKLGGFLQDFIAAHGYVVNSPILPFRNSGLRRLFLQNWLQRQDSGVFHFILGENTYHEFKDILDGLTNSTLTLVPRDVRMENLSEPLAYRLHRLFCLGMGAKAEPFAQTLADESPEFYDRFLDHCIELAENETL